MRWFISDILFTGMSIKINSQVCFLIIWYPACYAKQFIPESQSCNELTFCHVRVMHVLSRVGAQVLLGRTQVLSPTRSELKSESEDSSPQLCQPTLPM